MTELTNKRKEYGLEASDLKRLSKRTPYFWVRDLICDWAIMIGAFIVVGLYPNVVTVFLALLVIGNRQHALALLGHDGTHVTISYNSRLNDFLTNFFTWIPIGLTLDGYRNLHRYHHSELGTENDPEVIYKAIRSEQWNLPKNVFDVLKMAALDLVGNGIPDYKVIFMYSKPTDKKEYYYLFGCHAVVSSILVASGLWWVPAIWYFSLPTAFIMFFRIRLWLEHHGTDTTHRLHLNPIQGALFAPHLSWHHWEHHNWPSVPYHNLPALRELISGKEIMSLSDLIAYYQNCEEIPAGKALKETVRNTNNTKNPAYVESF